MVQVCCTGMVCILNITNTIHFLTKYFSNYRENCDFTKSKKKISTLENRLLSTTAEKIWWEADFFSSKTLSTYSFKKTLQKKNLIYKKKSRKINFAVSSSTDFWIAWFIHWFEICRWLQKFKKHIEERNFHHSILVQLHWCTLFYY